MPALDDKQLKICQDAFDTVVAEKSRYGFAVNEGYLSIAIMELYAKGYRSHRSLVKMAASLPLERRGRR